ncbi:MAG: NAD-dependent succinate-semialdehyde dehydrogenase [Pseudanabaenaceae cyanobacterium]|jgi:succinate-semialdehyde dehydrogenase/glutarate-semialdehyde dehydrogenase
MAIRSVNPATGEVLRTFTPFTTAEVEQCLSRAQTAFSHHRCSPLTERSEGLHRAATILEARKLELAQLITLEMGKPIRSALAEIEKCAFNCHFYAANAAQWLADVSIDTEASQSLIRFEPLGIILAVMPWNFPFWQVFRFLAPCLMAGNVALIKHASNVPQCAMAIEAVMIEAGFTHGEVQNLLVEGAKVGSILADSRVRGVTLTGSEAAGRSVASIAGQNLKKTVLELGGSDPFIITASADLDSAVKIATKSRMINSGQTCISAKRFIVVEPVAAAFTTALVEAFRNLRVGDPNSPDTDLGPLATAQILQELHHQVVLSVEAGAKCLIGGQPVASMDSKSHVYIHLSPQGNFYPPTILTDIPINAPAYGEELFGPVAAVFTVPDLDAAIALANDTRFGLAATVWSQDSLEIERCLNELEVGAIFVNEMVKSDPRVPFGGTKDSGYGRELGQYGLTEFVNIKTVWIK